MCPAVELPPITEDDRRVATDAAEMVLPKRPPVELDDPPLQPTPESPLHIDAREDALSEDNDSEPEEDDSSEPAGPEGARRSARRFLCQIGAFFSTFVVTQTLTTLSRPAHKLPDPVNLCGTRSACSQLRGKGSWS